MVQCPTEFKKIIGWLEERKVLHKASVFGTFFQRRGNLLDY